MLVSYNSTESFEIRYKNEEKFSVVHNHLFGCVIIIYCNLNKLIKLFLESVIILLVHNLYNYFYRKIHKNQPKIGFETLMINLSC